MYHVMEQAGFKDIRPMPYQTRYFYLKNTLLFMAGRA